jgi:hypothetical protein
MFLQIPGIGSRDLEDAVVEQHGSDEWIRYGGTLYRPQATVPVLGAGADTVTFGAEGYAEWRSLATGGAVTIAAGGATTWRLYSPDFAALDSGTTFPATVTAPTAGSYLLLFGPAGASTTVTVAPAASAAAEAAAGAAAPTASPKDRTPWPRPFALPTLREPCPPDTGRADDAEGAHRIADHDADRRARRTCGQGPGERGRLIGRVRTG